MQVWAVALGIVLGTSCACAGAAVQHVGQNEADGQEGLWRFEAVQDSRSNSYGSSVEARVILPDGRRVLVNVETYNTDEVFRYGDVFQATATLMPLSETSLSYSWSRGVCARACLYQLDRIDRDDIFGLLVGCRNKILDSLSEQNIEATATSNGKAVISALVCGWRGDLQKSEIYQDFKVSGLAHLVAVSGAHLSIVTLFFTGLLRALHVPRKLATALQITAILIYLLLAAAPPSALRAAIMACAAMLSFVAKRRPSALNALSLCVIGCIVLDPSTAVSVSFALSALSTLGIVLFAQLASSWIAKIVFFFPQFAREALALTFASGLLATPLSAAIFAQLPLVAPLANIVVTPFFPFVCAGGLCAAFFSLLIPPAAPFLFGFALKAADGFVALVHLIAKIPYASIPVQSSVALALLISVSVAGALWIFWPKPSVKTALLLMVVSLCLIFGTIVVVPRLAPDEIVMLDVGQGDAILLRSQGSAVLIDTGNHDQLLREALARHGVASLDAVIISHSDDDHMGSLPSLHGVVQVKNVLVARDALSCSCSSCRELIDNACALVGKSRVVGLAMDDEVQVGIFDLKTIWPSSYVEEGENSDSLCLLATIDANNNGQGDWTALFVGDAEADQLSNMIENGDVGTVDIYKVGHHGSKNAIDDELAQTLSPDIALIGVGAHNRYGHPTEEALSALEQAGAYIFRTDEHGDVSCKITRDQISVDTLR